MLQDQQVTKAVSGILQRSERQEDINKLVASFVDIGILPQLDNRNNQILYGRRGTGKTHVLKVLYSRLTARRDTIAVYVDARTLGSTSQFADPTVSTARRCLLLFQDMVAPIHNAIYEHILNHPPERAMDVLSMADELTQCIIAPIKTLREEKRETTEKTEHSQSTSLTGNLAKDPSLTAVSSTAQTVSDGVASTFAVSEENKIIFPMLHDLLSRILEAAKCNLFFLIDEWSSLPLDLQPYLAEFLRRGFLPLHRATLKIGALEYRSRFFEKMGATTLGFELGADVSTTVDLDDYYVIDRNPESLTTLYADMLLKHLNVDLPADYLATKYGITSGDILASRLYTERATFREVARAAEGVVRDLINIFTLSYYHAQRRQRESIDRQAVIEASRQWFEQDKATHLDDDMQEVLRRIIAEVIGKRQARSFLIPRELQKHPMIQRLFDARVLHQMQRGYADKDNPGLRYNIYTLDYGTYVDLLGTSKQPQMDMTEHHASEPVVVPFDDKRSIRRIILTKEVLE